MFNILDHLVAHDQKGPMQIQHMPGILLRLFQRALLNRLLMNLIKGQDPTNEGQGGMMKDIYSLCRAPEISHLYQFMQRYGYSVFTWGTHCNYKCYCGYSSTDGLPAASCKHCGSQIHLICTLGSQFTLDSYCVEHASEMPELHTYSETYARRWQQLLREQYPIAGRDSHSKDVPHDDENTDSAKPEIQGNLSKNMLSDPGPVAEDDSDNNSFTMDELSLIQPDTNMNREMLHEGITDVIKRLQEIKEFSKLILYFPDSTALAQYREGN